MTTATGIAPAYRVNTNTNERQSDPRIVNLTNGNYVIVWVDEDDEDEDGAYYDVKAQLFAADGSEIGDEIAVATVTAGDQDSPRVVALDDGGFYVSWTDYESSLGGNLEDVFGHAFDASGDRTGSLVQLNTSTNGPQEGAFLTSVGSNGVFAVWWDRETRDLTARVFGNGGQSGGGEFIIHDGQTYGYAATTLANGNVLVTFQVASAGVDLVGKIYSPSGSLLVSLFPIAADIASATFTVAALDDGNFLVSWIDGNFQIFDSAGESVSEVLPVAEDRSVIAQSAAALANGRFVIVWVEPGSILYGQVFNANGTPFGDIFEIGDIALGSQGSPRVAALNGNEFVVTWAQGSDIYAQNFGVGEQIDGTTGNDPLLGTKYADIIIGFAGNDTLDGAGGDDLLQGGYGNDTYYVDTAATQVIEASGRGTDTVYARVSYKVAAGQSIETLATSRQAGTAAINLTGNELAQTVRGNAGANVLDGGGGGDSMYGLGGSDTYYVSHASDQVFEVAGQGTDTVYARVSYTLAAAQSVELLSASRQAATTAIDLTGNELGQTIRGNAGANIIDGRGGIDHMYGFAGNDTYYVDRAADNVFEISGQGIDTVYARVSYVLDAGQSIELLATYKQSGTEAIHLTGNEIAQTVRGNAGNNLINGGRGSDTLAGGAGFDTFVFDTALSSSTNVDTILDFSVAQDTIRLENAIFTALTATGTLAASAFHIGSAAADGLDRIIYNSGNGRLYYDADGSGAGGASHFATLSTGLALTNLDFVVA